MKNFLLVLGGVIILVVSICLSHNKLSDLLSKDINIESGVKEVLMASGDLGFIFEKQENARCISYIKENKIVGQCVLIEVNKDKINYVCSVLGLTIHKKYSLGNRLIIEGSSALLDYSMKGTNQNVQICYKKGLITVGSPIIYGNY